jgi:sugar lactone lactonase YvrE
MRRQHLPIYAKLSSRPLPLPREQWALIPHISSAATTLARPNYEVLTIAGRQDHVVATRGVRALPQRVPVWRSGFRDGRSGKALFNKPTGLAVDAQGLIYVADTLNHCIRRISRQGRVSTLAGSGERGHSDGRGPHARFNHPTGLALAPNGQLYVIDSHNHCLRGIAPDGQTTTLPGVGRPLGGIACSASGEVYFSTELRMRQTTFRSICRIRPNGTPEILTDQHGQLSWKPYRSGDEHKPTNPWYQDKPTPLTPYALPEQLHEAADLALDRKGALYFVEQNHLFSLSPQGHLQIIPLRYDNTEHAVCLSEYPAGLAVDEYGHLYLSDTQNHCIRRISPQGQVKTVAGYHSPERPWQETDQFCAPQGIAIDSLGRIFIADTGHWRICQLIPPEAQWHKRLNQTPWFPAPASQISRSDTRRPRQGVWNMVRKSLPWLTATGAPPPEPPVATAFPDEYLQTLLQQNSRGQQLSLVREVLERLKPEPRPDWQDCRPFLQIVLQHEDISLRALLTREICELVHSAADALFWLDLLEHSPEPNRLLRRYRIDILVWIGQTWDLYGQIVPLLVDCMRDPEPDVVAQACERLRQIRSAGYESLVDPLVEDLTR